MQQVRQPVTDLKTRRPKSFARRLVSWGALSLLVLLGLALLAIVANNFSLTRVSREEFRSKLDRALNASTDWLTTHPEVMANPSLMYMINDMANMSGDSRLRGIVEQYRHSKYLRDPIDPLRFVWLRMIDSGTYVPTIDGTHAQEGDVVELLWDAYAVVPDRVAITRAQRDNMFSPTKFSWGRRQHQLLALDMYRHYNGGSEELNSTINHLAEKVARDAHFDFRVTDSYIQRIAFVLAAERPDLIRARWIDRALDHQTAQGGWRYCWYGWCRGILEFSLRDIGAAHTTVQATWGLYMLKYRFPQWIERNYQ